MYKALSIEYDQHVAVVTLNRPELLNRVDAILHRELVAVLADLREGRETRAVVLASTGDVFSAGGDFDLIREVHDDPVVRWREIDHGRQIVERLIDLPLPIIAALQGHAAGVGATLVLGCDAIVAARGVKIVDPHVLIGIAAGDGGALFWPEHIGMLRAKRYLLTGDPVVAEDGLAMGLITDLVESPGDVRDAAMAIARRIAALPPAGVQGTKRILNAVMRQRSAEILDLSFAMAGHSHITDDVIEAVNAFKEKRPGLFHGR